MAKARTKRETRHAWNKLCAKWKDRFWLGHWRIDTEIRDMQKARVPGGSSGGNYGRIAQAEYSAAYQDATLVLNEGNAKVMSDKDMNRTACHESLHLVLAPLVMAAIEAMDHLPALAAPVYRSMFDQALERVTVQLENIFIYEEKKRRAAR